MRAVSMQSNTARDLALIDVPVPEPGPGEVRIKVEAVGICGSDVSMVLAKPNFDFVERPRVFGHEFAGTIDAVGAGSGDWQTGQRVTCLSVLGCLQCDQCRGGNTSRCERRQVLGYHMTGAMAEWVTVDARYILPLGRLSFVEGALLEPLAVACRCVHKACDIAAGYDSVVVSGCGIIGLLCALVARAGGVDVAVTGLQLDAEVRLKKVQELGFRTIVLGDGEPSLREQLDRPADLLIEASGAPVALAAAGQSVAWGGLIGVVATYGHNVDLPVTELVRAEQRLQTSFGGSRDDFEQAIAHIENGDIPVESLVDTYAFDDAIGAVDDSIAKTTQKAVLLPGT